MDFNTHLEKEILKYKENENRKIDISVHIVHEFDYVVTRVDMTAGVEQEQAKRIASDIKHSIERELNNGSK